MKFKFPSWMRANWFRRVGTKATESDWPGTVERLRVENAQLVQKLGETSEKLLTAQTEIAKLAEHKSKMTEQESKNRRAITALLAWIYTTHKIDQRADQTGLTDILKDFPPLR